MKRTVCVLICILMLLPWVGASEKTALAKQLDSFVSQNKLNEENFAMYFFNTVTGETYEYNSKAMFPVGEVWTLPLHMYYVLQENNGAFLPEEGSPEALDPEYEYKINGMNLDTCRLESIIEGNKSVSDVMRDAVMNYKDVINEEFGHLPDSELNDSYREGNCYSAKFLMNCMLELTREPELYGELMRLYDMVAQPQGYFAAENSAASKYRTVQLRGEEEGYICAVAEISTASPYLLVSIVSKEAGGDALLASLNNLIAVYVEAEIAPTTEAPTESKTDDSVYKVNSTVADRTPVFRITLIALGALAALVVLALITMRIIRRFRKY